MALIREHNTMAHYFLHALVQAMCPQVHVLYFCTCDILLAYWISYAICLHSSFYLKAKFPFHSPSYHFPL